MNNKVTGLPKEEGFTTFADLAMSVINQAPKEGFDVDEMSIRLKMRAKLEEANGTINLASDEIIKLKELTAVFKWGIMHEDLIDFIKTVKELK
jgi:hypothetical protein